MQVTELTSTSLRKIRILLHSSRGNLEQAKVKMYNKASLDSGARASISSETCRVCSLILVDMLLLFSLSQVGPVTITVPSM